MRDFAASRVAQGHDVRWLQLYDGTELHTTICSDFTKQEILVKNHVQDPKKTAFGENANPPGRTFGCLPRNDASSVWRRTSRRT